MYDATRTVYYKCILSVGLFRKNRRDANCMKVSGCIIFFFHSQLYHFYFANKRIPLAVAVQTRLINFVQERAIVYF